MNIKGCAIGHVQLLWCWLCSLVIALGSTGHILSMTEATQIQFQSCSVRETGLDTLWHAAVGAHRCFKTVGAWFKARSCPCQRWTGLAAHAASGGSRAERPNRLNLPAANVENQFKSPQTWKLTHFHVCSTNRSPIVHLCWRVTEMTCDLRGQQWSVPACPSSTQPPQSSWLR